MTQQLVGVLIDGVLAIAIVAAATVLLALGKIDAQTAIALFGTAVVLVGGSAKALLALHVPTATRPAVSPAPALPAPPAATAP